MLLKYKNFLSIASSLTGLRTAPVYVQFYITARCNLTCKQCNIIYANANVREATTDEIDAIAENLKQIGTSIVLLTGGEPFVRRDLPAIVSAFTRRGIHVRTQTNGLASREQMSAVVEAGARDISISLDSLTPPKQDFLNGSFESSWDRALEAISSVTHTYPVIDSFAVFGTVLSPQNILEVPNIIRFATRIGWYVSLVPAHISPPSTLHNFRSSDREMQFPKELYPLMDKVIDECITLKRQGYSLYDSYEYLDNIKKFIRGEPVQWRRRNNNRCDSPELYFAIRPNGDLQVCCDHILQNSYPVWHPEFPSWYRQKRFHPEVHWHTKRCSGCMYGSYPEISITAHFPSSLLERLPVFWRTKLPKPWPLTKSDLLAIIEEIRRDNPVDESQLPHLLEPLTSHAAANILLSSRQKSPSVLSSGASGAPKARLPNS